MAYSSAQIAAQPPIQQPKTTQAETDVEKAKEQADEVDVEISEKELDKYFECLIDGLEYSEERSYLGGKFKAIFRTKRETEAAKIFERIGKEDPGTTAEFETKLCKYYLCYALVSVTTPKKTIHIDSGSLSERVERVNALSSPQYMLLIRGMFDFDTKIDEMRKRAYNENFT